MSEPIISVEGLGKSYLVGHQSSGREQYTALRDVLGRTAKDFGRKAWDMARGRQIIQGDDVEEFWALKDVSFDVNEGEVLGVIGRNGAGKSTLLKVLSRITEPTQGKVTLRGRVASLLEVGTGFHPELSGRENIFLNGAILGMTRTEIKNKFDEIVDFAGVEKFLDTPVKRYSSGMYVRLAFAVAAHLEPEILIVDEVLAVGDAEFQKKCLGKMQDVARGGRTVLFVSHNMAAIEKLCDRCVSLKAGKVELDSRNTRDVIASHLASGINSSASTSWENSGGELDHPCVQILSMAIIDENGRPIPSLVRNDQAVTIEIKAKVKQRNPTLNLGFAIFSYNSEELLWSLSTDGHEREWPKLNVGTSTLHCRLPTRLLNEGQYRVELIASLHRQEWISQPGHNAPVLAYEIRGGLSDSPYWVASRPGILAPEFGWKTIDSEAR